MILNIDVNLFLDFQEISRSLHVNLTFWIYFRIFVLVPEHSDMKSLRQVLVATDVAARGLDIKGVSAPMQS